MEIEDKVKQFVTRLYEENKTDNLLFHGLRHTQEVVDVCKLIGKEMEISIDEMEILTVSAWFHDTGYIHGTENHELKSIEIAKEFLNSNNYSSSKIEKVEGCIKATGIPQKPTNDIENIICDADMFHFSLEDFYNRSMLLWKEISIRSEKKVGKKSYRIETLELLKIHKYKTKYGMNILQELKEKNIKKLEKKIAKIEKDADKKPKTSNVSNDKSKVKSPYRGVESLFRITANNQMSLSSIADSKANILITVNSIMLSLIISFLFNQLSEYPYILFPTLIFLATSLVTIIYAILATRPKISTGTFTKEDIQERRVNLLFFGNFYNMDINEYETALKEIMSDYDGLYGTIIKDQYYLGAVLAKKYKLLRSAYSFFMYGIIATVLAFVITIVPTF